MKHLLQIETAEDFNNISKSKFIVLFHFWAEWNGTDYLMKKVLDELSKEFNNQAVFASIDVDSVNLYELCRSIPIVNVPTLIYFKNGSQVSVDVGFTSKKLNIEKEKIKSKLKDLLDNND